jgi:catecholate siderophore receptor
MKPAFDSRIVGFENKGEAFMAPWNSWVPQPGENPLLFRPSTAAKFQGLAAEEDLDLTKALNRIVGDLRNASGAWIYIRRWMVRIAVAGYLTAVPLKAAATVYSTNSDTPDAVSNTSTATAGPNPSASETMPQLTVIGTSDKPKSLSGVKYQGPLVDTPQSATVVDQDQMQDQGTTTMRDALRNVSGISLSAGEFSQQGDTLTIRGFSISHDFFLDGMRDFGSYYRDPFELSEVEVLKGPSGLLFGDGTTGGVVNQVSKEPQMDPSYQGSLGIGTDMTRRATVDINSPVPALGSDAAFRLNVVADQNNVADRNVAQNSIGGLAPTLELGVGGPTRLTLSYLHIDENDIPDYGIPWLLNEPAPVPRQNYYGFLDDYLRTSVDLETVKLEHDFNDSLSLSEKIRYGNYYRDVRITEPQIPGAEAVSIQNGTLALSAATVTDNELAVYSTETSFDNQTDLTGKFQTAGIKHTLQGGVEAVIETSDPTQSKYAGVPTQNLMNPNEDLSFTAASVSISSQVSASVTTLAAYALDTIDLDEKWQLIGGLRFDNVNSSYANPIAPAPNSFKTTDNLWNWRAGLVFKPEEYSSIYFVAGTSSDPSAESLSLTAATAPQPPQETTTYELGTKWGLLDNQLNLTGALFWDEMDNALVEDPTNPAADVNAGTERARGFELGVSGYITSVWEVMAGYTFLDSEFVDFSSASISGGVTNISNLTGYALRNAPEDTVNFWSTYTLSDKFQIGAGLDAVTDRQGGKFGFVSSTTPGTYTITGPIEDVPGYITFSAMVKYNLDKNISIQANGTNLGDAYYIDQVHPGHLVPGAGRTVLVTTNFKF